MSRRFALLHIAAGTGRVAFAGIHEILQRHSTAQVIRRSLPLAAGMAGPQNRVHSDSRAGGRHDQDKRSRIAGTALFALEPQGVFECGVVSGIGPWAALDEAHVN